MNNIKEWFKWYFMGGKSRAYRALGRTMALAHMRIPLKDWPMYK
jgi:hypothetical protein